MLDLLEVIELPVILNPILLGALLSYVTIEVVSRFGIVSAQEHERREQMHQVPEEEFDPGRLHGTLKWSRLVALFGVVTAALLIGFYALPYGRALKEAGITEGNTLFFSGEVAWSIGVGLALVVCGYLASRGAVRSFIRRQ